MLRRNIVLSLIPDRIILSLATLGSIGTKLPAPGTFGSVAGLLLALLYLPFLHPLLSLALSILLMFFAVSICHEAEIRIGKRDPGEIILDEAVAMPFVFIGILPLSSGSPAWPHLLTGFLLFRFFDILKPLGINRLQKLPGGEGIVYDDIAAAIAASIVLHLLVVFKLLPG
ncbi:MAG: phosphatidylglycerophosphatase A [Puniceicoccaceae bacterium]